MDFIKKIIRKLFFGNKYILKIKHIGKNSKIGLFHNILNGKYIYIGDHSAIGRFSKLHCYDHYCGDNFNPKFILGNNCTIGCNFTLWCTDDCILEDYVTLAGYVSIMTENHGINPESNTCYRNQKLVSSKVVIKEGTWVGERCCILPGVTIGKKCVIGSGSVVTKSIPDYCIAVGNPAKVIKKYNFKTHKWEKYEE